MPSIVEFVEGMEQQSNVAKSTDAPIGASEEEFAGDTERDPIFAVTKDVLIEHFMEKSAHSMGRVTKSAIKRDARKWQGMEESA
mmetsp:Transcript_14937/g.27201  ORF Transcript_14937/g.27201 Transcript_14937/m.27201 type:complete len:84 (+) Transcript_14937:277-528(+)